THHYTLSPDGNVTVIEVWKAERNDLSVMRRPFGHDLGFGVDDLKVKADNFLIDSDVNLTVTLRNRGDFAEENFTVTFASAAPDSGVEVFETQRISGLFDANSTMTLTAHYSIPSSVARTFVVTVDPDNDLLEDDEGNNVVSFRAA